MSLHECKLLEGFLVFESSERVIARDVLGVDLDHHAGVGIRRVAMGGRHAVDDACAGCTTGRDDVSARAHTEGIDAATVHLGDEGVGGVAEVFDDVFVIS